MFEPFFSTTVMNTFQFVLWTAKLAAEPLRVFLASPRDILGEFGQSETQGTQFSEHVE